MKNLLLTATVILLILGCKKKRNNSTIDALHYEEGIQNCIKIKEVYPDNYFASKNCLAGYPLPNFQTQTINGKTIDNKLLLGKPAIINFWFTTCAPCIAEIPGFNEIALKYGEKVNFLSISRNTKAEIENFLVTHPWDFNHISNEKNIIENVFKIPFGYPTTFIINKEGLILESFSGGPVGEEAIQIIMEKIIPILDNEI